MNETGVHQCTGRPSASTAANFTSLNPVHRWTSVVFTDFATKGTPLSTVIYPRWPSNDIPASSDATDTVTPADQSMNIPDESSPAMPQTPHPLDVVVDELDDFGRDLVRIFTRDNEIDDAEHALLKRHGVIFMGTSGYRLREVAADSYKRNGASQLTVDRFKAVGHGLIDLEAERKARPGANVVSFPTRQNAG